MDGKSWLWLPDLDFFGFSSSSLPANLLGMAGVDDRAGGKPDLPRPVVAGSGGDAVQLIEVMDLITVPGLKTQGPSWLEHQQVSLPLRRQGSAQMAPTQLGCPALKACERA